MAAQVYLYNRFSSVEQRKGGSLERQAEYAKNIAKKYGLKINDELIMTDEGLSAFHAKHLKRGALGLFMSSVESGLVDEGSVLIIESLDRLSREDILSAQTLFLSLVNRGITIVTAIDEQVYSQQSLREQPLQFIQPLALMIRAHDESLTKQKRSVAFIKQQVKKFKLDGSGDVAGSTPYWISKTPNGYELNENSDSVKVIVEQYLNNKGLNQIARYLTENGYSTPSNKRDSWGVTTIRKILDNPALYGLKAFKMKSLLNGREIIEKFELEGYYPSITTRANFLSIQAAKASRTNSRESYGNNTYFLSSYGKNKVVCSVCRTTVRSQLQKQYNRKGEFTKTAYRLHCGKHKETLDCCKSFEASELEKAFLSAVASNISASEIKEKSIDLDSIDSKKAEIGDLKTQLTKMFEILLDINDNDFLVQAKDKIQSLEKEKIKLEDELAELETETPQLRCEDHIKLNQLVDECQDIKSGDLRVQLKQMLLKIVDQIIIDFKAKSLAVIFKNSDPITITYDRKNKSYISEAFIQIRLRKDRFR
ncbi:MULTISPECIES: recombinase family protein [unclassified Vibrio]|uniref:recombinase family protein n=1 Tax=unclassified Vibrio TaxID=2614977 RepID=UPI000AD6D375|nr:MULTISPECIES: recombinase family protein [unclassified Vibrio]